MLNLNYPLNVVLIDDDPDMLDLMEFYLRNNTNYKSHKFTSPILALDFMSNNQTAIAIVDINMDEMAGEEVLRKVNELGHGTQVIIATASNNLLTFTACFHEKATGFIFKPFTQEKFLQTIEHSHSSIKSWHNIFLEMMKRKHKKSA